MTLAKHQCRLCEALNNPFAFGEIRACDTIIFKTSNFVLLPSIGPLIRGHVMIVSKKHYFSLASMPKDAIREYEAFVQQIFQLHEISGDLLEAEHGATPNCIAGGCVAHTHIHLLPTLGKYIDIFDDKLKSAGMFSEISKIHDFKEPYIFLRQNINKIKMFHADSVPSQEIRRVLCNRLGQKNWDWRTDARDELVEETINFWKKTLANAKTS